MEGDRCDFCSEGRLRSQQVREYYRAGEGLVVMERVPAYVCDRCGERYYDAHVAKQVRQLAKNRGSQDENLFPGDPLPGT